MRGNKNKKTLCKKSNRFCRTIRGRSHKDNNFTYVFEDIKRWSGGYTLRFNALTSRPPKHSLNAYINSFKRKIYDT